MSNKTIPLAEALLSFLEAAEIKSVFTLPGAGIVTSNGIFTKFHQQNKVREIPAYHEGNAAYAALGYAQATGKPGVSFVSRGPGLLHEAAGILSAWEGFVPTVTVHVQHPLVHATSPQPISIQQLNPRMFKDITAKVFQPRTSETAAKQFLDALETACKQSKPVILDLPQDLLTQEISEAAFQKLLTRARTVTNPVPSIPKEDTLHECVEWINCSKKPLVISGNLVSLMQARDDLGQFAEKFNLPVAANYHKHGLPDSHSNNAGILTVATAPYMRQAVDESDLLIFVGHVPNDVDFTQYRKDSNNLKNKKCIIINPDSRASERLAILKKHYGLEFDSVLEIQGNLNGILSRLSALGNQVSSTRTGDRRYQELHATYQSLIEDQLPTERRWQKKEGPLDLAEVAKIISRVNGERGHNLGITLGAGDYFFPLTPHLRIENPRLFQTIYNGTMTGELAGAQGMCEAHPDKVVVAITGDGAATMAGFPALAAAIPQKAKIVYLVIDNSAYGAVRSYSDALKRQDEHQSHSHNTILPQTNYSALDKVFPGTQSMYVGRTEDFEFTFRKALAAAEKGKPVVLHLDLLNRQVNHQR